MSELRKRWTLLRNPHADIRFGRGVYLGPGLSLHMPVPGAFIVGDRAEFRRDFHAEITGGGRVTIGTECVFTYSTLIQCTTTIDIGDRCLFAQAASLLDGQHRFRDLTQPMASQGFDFSPVRIGDDVGIMSKCTVMADVGDRAFIGANAVVSNPIPPYTVAVGVPARPIEYFGPPGDEPAAPPAS
jgi:acetyltransferase-like isoleucine patch superfamily enzyme